MLVVLDTSVMVAALKSDRGASRLWLDSILDRKNSLALSVPLAMEYEAVLKRPAMLKSFGLAAGDVDDLMAVICRLCEQVELYYRLRPILRDPADEMVLETAVFGRVDALLTFNLRDFAGSERVGVTVEEPGPAWRKAKESSQ